MTVVYKNITRCRSCGSTKLHNILSLGKLAVSDFIKADESATLAPLSLILCGHCKLVQLKNTAVDPDLLYRQYWYKSGINHSMREALLGIVKKAVSIVRLKSGDIVLDIGANDGTLLRDYMQKGLRKIGFEPAVNLIPEATIPNNEIINNFFNESDFKALAGDKKAKIITSIAMFYDLENPNQFVQDLSNILADDGIWINQLSYLPSMLEEMAFDNICHEHIEYYSLSSLTNLLARHDLEVFDVELNDVNGGSFRVYIKHRMSKLKVAGGQARITSLLAKEKLSKIDQRDTYYRFVEQIISIKQRLTRFIKTQRKLGKTFAVYGASTKGNTLLQYFKLNYPLIMLAADRNPSKWGSHTVKTKIPIVSEITARTQKPDYFLVLPWHFKTEFLARERDYLLSGGTMIYPLPHPHLVTIKNGEFVTKSL